MHPAPINLRRNLPKAVADEGKGQHYEGLIDALLVQW
jgi:hypothetical protein